MQATNICQPCRQPETQVFGRATQDQLRKRETNKSDEEKWTGVYRTLFPDDTEIPLPCKPLNISAMKITPECSILS